MVVHHDHPDGGGSGAGAVTVAPPSRMLLLASAGSPGFLDLGPVRVDSVVIEALGRWGHTPRRWRLGEVAEATVLGDCDRLGAALDALLETPSCTRTRTTASSTGA